MTKFRITMGLSLVLMTFAVSATTAMAAVEAHQLKSGVESKGEVQKEKLLGSTLQVFTIGSGANALTVECAQFEAQGSQKFPTTQIVEGELKFTQCKGKAEGVAVAKIEVTTHECKFNFHPPTTIAKGGKGVAKPAVSVECGKEPIQVKLTSLACEVLIGSNANLSEITYTNLAPNLGVSGVANVTGIKQTNTCGLSGEVTYKGTATISADEAGENIQLY